MSSETAGDAARAASESVILIPYPKIVFLWPSFVAAIVAAIWTTIAGAGSGGSVIAGWVFLITLSINLVVLSFDFPRATSLTFFFVGVALVLGGALLAVYLPDVLPAVGGWLTAIDPYANAAFYWVFTAVMAVIYVGVWINTRFDYWEVRPNELLHHHGMLSDLERFSAPHLRIDKEINDIFEYLLMGSGRLILHPSNERRAVVLENVFWITRKEKAITKMLGALQVQVRSEEA